MPCAGQFFSACHNPSTWPGSTAELCENILQPPKEGTTSGYAIYINTFFQGPVAAERSESDKPIAYPTERAAQCEIVESTIIRPEQFLAVERDFEDVTTIEEYILPVDLHPDGSITDENGNTFPNDSC